MRGIALILGLYILVALISRTGKAFQDYYVNVISERIGTSLYNDTLAHIFKLPFALFEDEQSGSLLQKLQQARDRTKKLIQEMISIGFFSLVGIIFVYVYAFTVHWLIGLVFLLSLPLIGGIVYVTGTRIKQAQELIVRRSADLAASTTETLHNVGLVKALGLENQEIERLEKVHHDILDLELKKVVMLRTLSFTQGTLINIASTLIVFVSLILIFQGHITLGEFLALWFYGFFVFGPLGQIADMVRSYQEARASFEIIEALYRDYTPARHEITRPVFDEPVRRISLENVSFEYGQGLLPSLSGVTCSFESGKTYACVGPSGAGKSTLIKLILGLYEPTQGTLTYNHHPHNTIAMHTLRARIGYVPQDTQVFAGTLRENLLFAAPHATDEDCIEALTQAQAHGILERSTAGLDTRIGENGIKISGGERQRIALARALIRKPDILIFDEATSSLDSITEKEITETIQRLRDDHPHLITIMIAHRLSTVEHADTLYVLRKGEIVETGSHSELVEHKGLYYSLWNEQQ
ncbi:MAG: ABC transporter ATP-binding protein/permease [Candidatus Pacebacteria bacterium]|nr:ABC transporter ATP-binding protein/permease [Candidatus Paceibacterota bacterium]